MESAFQVTEFDGDIRIKYNDGEKGYSFTVRKDKFLKAVKKII